jgi:hypothetical protein
LANHVAPALSPLRIAERQARLPQLGEAENPKSVTLWISDWLAHLVPVHLKAQVSVEENQQVLDGVDWT